MSNKRASIKDVGIKICILVLVITLHNYVLKLHNY